MIGGAEFPGLVAETMIDMAEIATPCRWAPSSGVGWTI